ncbi:hypothetical protein ACVIOG_006493 [Rhizobium leguminosarum]
MVQGERSVSSTQRCVARSDFGFERRVIANQRQTYPPRGPSIIRKQSSKPNRTIGSGTSRGENQRCPHRKSQTQRLFSELLRCGKRSAYNRGGSYAPICFVGDISHEMIAAFREQDGQQETVIRVHRQIAPSRAQHAVDHLPHVGVDGAWSEPRARNLPTAYYCCDHWRAHLHLRRTSRSHAWAIPRRPIAAIVAAICNDLIEYQVAAE